jgi:hypothetical protein
LTGTCLRFNTTNNNQQGWFSKSLPTNQGTMGVAFAVRFSALPQAAAMPIVAFCDGGTTQVDLRVDGAGNITITRAGSLLATVPLSVKTNAYIHLELKVKFDPTVGTIYLGINGVQALNLTGQNTRNSVNSYANVINMGVLLTNTTNSITTNVDFDDFIVYDGQANDPQGNPDITGPIGDCAATWLLPNGAGTTTQWTPDAGTNYARVNEATPDGDTSYVSSSTVGQIDTYAIADLPANIQSVKSIAVVSFARKDDAGARQIAAEIRTGGVNYQGTSVYTMATGYAYFMNNWGSNPNTLAAWTPAGVNAIEAGHIVIA